MFAPGPDNRSERPERAALRLPQGHHALQEEGDPGRPGRRFARPGRCRQPHLPSTPTARPGGWQGRRGGAGTDQVAKRGGQGPVNVLVYVESRWGRVRAAGFEALATGRKLATDTGGSLTALLVGPDAGSLASGLDGFGIDRLLAAMQPELSGYSPEGYGAVVEAASKASGAEVIL
ncbi:MAG: hypothetical protein FJY67_04440, partial [Calditrichaeota bacterium]|nr:hypothetical protein [Calditrichota bacterium]